jgi:hypothetical protein
MQQFWHYMTVAVILFMVAILTYSCFDRKNLKSMDHKNLRLQTGTDSFISVPLEGPRYDKLAAAVARKINRTSNDLVAWQKARKAKSVVVERAILEMAISMQWDAAKNIDLAYRIAEKTSGPLDPGLINKAFKLAADVDVLLKIQPPDSPFVSTSISTTVDGASLHYMSIEDYHRKKEGNWSSYTSGQVMRIGRYMFRVQPPSSDQDIYQEIVLIISDPTILRLTPVIGGLDGIQSICQIV